MTTQIQSPSGEGKHLRAFSLLTCSLVCTDFTDRVFRRADIDCWACAERQTTKRRKMLRGTTYSGNALSLECLSTVYTRDAMEHPNESTKLKNKQHQPLNEIETRIWLSHQQATPPLRWHLSVAVPVGAKPLSHKHMKFPDAASTHLPIPHDSMFGICRVWGHTDDWDWQRKKREEFSKARKRRKKKDGEVDGFDMFACHTECYKAERERNGVNWRSRKSRKWRKNNYGALMKTIKKDKKFERSASYGA